MGSKYKKKFEREWDGKDLSDIKIAMLQKQADRNITRILKKKSLVIKKRGYR